MVKLGDFGLAQLGGKRVNTDKVDGGIAGTPGFLAPEMLRGEPYNAKTDIWALGCTLYEMATLRSAYVDLYNAATDSVDFPLVAVGKHVPVKEYGQPFVDFLSLLLAAKPEERPTTDKVTNEKREEKMFRIQNLGGQTRYRARKTYARGASSPPRCDRCLFKFVRALSVCLSLLGGVRF